ncbi:hypothetical protein JCM11641_002702 [Rhodosporidiobolus odoratus]
MPSNPLPVSLPAECRKAKNIFASFVDPVNGLDSLIPPSILRRAKGFCFMSIAKAGFVLSARAGSGLVIAKLADGNWSAPSAVGTAGGGVGFQMGVEVTEFLIILNSRKAVKSFMAKGSIAVGGNMSIAAGPLGRNVEGTGTLSSGGAIAAMYSYSRSKGLFGGASIEGSIIVERSDANAKAYRSNVTAPQLLSGAVDPPPWAEDLIDTITRLTRPRSTIPGWIDETSGGADYPVDGDSDSDEAEWGTGRGGRARSGRNNPPYSSGGGGGGGGDGQTPDELRERGYAFGSSYAAGGSLDPENTKEKGRISSMLGSMSRGGRERSGSGSSRRSGRGGGGGEDPFATRGGSSSNLGYGGGGPAPGNEPRFETHFSPLEDGFDFRGTTASASTSRPVAASRSNSREPSSHALPTSTTSSPSLTRTSSTSKGKLTKPRSGSAASAGLRERAAGMQWGVSASSSAADSGPGRESFDALDDDRPLSSYTPSPSKPKRPPFGSRFRSSSSVSTSSSQTTQSPVTAFDPSALYSSSSSSTKPKSRLRSSTVPSSTTRSPFGDEAGNESTSSLSSFNDDDDKSASTSSHRPNLNRALSKPWDSEDESYFTSPARGKPSSASTYTSSPLPPSTSTTSGPHPTTPGGHSLLDLTQVEADFASVMDLAKHGGEAEVGSYSAAGVGAGGRSRSGTLTTGAGTGGRSRSGTLTPTGREGREARPVGIGKDGIGWAVARFDFPGVESTDLPFLKNDTFVILAKDDEEWWKARKGMREGIVPRNYLDAQFD